MQITGYKTVPLVRKDKDGMYILDDDIYWEVGEMYQYTQDAVKHSVLFGSNGYACRIMAYLYNGEKGPQGRPKINERLKFRDGEHAFMLLERNQSHTHDYAIFLANETMFSVPSMANYESAFSKFVKIKKQDSSVDDHA